MRTSVVQKPQPGAEKRIGRIIFFIYKYITQTLKTLKNLQHKGKINSQCNDFCQELLYLHQILHCSKQFVRVFTGKFKRHPDTDIEDISQTQDQNTSASPTALVALVSDTISPCTNRKIRDNCTEKYKYFVYQNCSHLKEFFEYHPIQSSYNLRSDVNIYQRQTNYLLM